MTTLGVVANIASILGLGVSIWVLVDLNKVKSRYLFAARFPALLARLSQESSEVSRLLNDFNKARDDVSVKLARAGVTVQSMSRKLPKNRRASTARLLSSIQGYDPTQHGEPELRAIYVGMSTVVEELKDYQEDIQWD